MTIADVKVGIQSHRLVQNLTTWHISLSCIIDRKLMNKENYRDAAARIMKIKFYVHFLMSFCCFIVVSPDD